MVQVHLYTMEHNRYRGFVQHSGQNKILPHCWAKDRRAYYDITEFAMFCM
jgi:hypothetical protein